MTGDSGLCPEIGHARPESPVTFLRNDRSRSPGIGGHVGPEYAKIAALYQNDDFGKDYLKGLKAALGDKAHAMIVDTRSG